VEKEGYDLSSNQASTVSVVDWQRVKRSGFQISTGTREIFLFFKLYRTVHGSTQPPIQWVPGFLLGSIEGGALVEHSPPNSHEVKNEWSYNSAPPACRNGAGI